MGFGEQGTKGKVLEGTREHEPVLGHTGTTNPLQFSLKGHVDHGGMW